MSTVVDTDNLTIEHCAAAGVDIHKMELTVTVRLWRGRRQDSEVRTRTFSALYAGLMAMIAWLLTLRVTAVAMEATGIFRERVYDSLREAGLKVSVLNAYHVRQIKGRKTDVADSRWLSRICQFGLGLPGFVPARPWRDLRQLTRDRRALVQDRARHQTRAIKVLDREGVRISGILTRAIKGVNGRRIIDGMILGLSPEAILDSLSWHVRSKLSKLGDALAFKVGKAGRYLLKDLMTELDRFGDRIARHDALIDEYLADHEHQIDLLMTMPGVSRVSACAILAEPGPDMSVFPTARHCASWAGLCPGNNESAGKRKSGRTRKGNAYLRAALVECAHAAVRTKGSQFQSFHRAITSRRGYKRAIVATAHKMLRISYAMLRDDAVYQNPHIDYERPGIEARHRRLQYRMEAYQQQDEGQAPPGSDHKATKNPAT